MSAPKKRRPRLDWFDKVTDLIDRLCSPLPLEPTASDKREEEWFEEVEKEAIERGEMDL